ncbi:hypothetical protein BH11MYX1_BH11MYX1_48070 [soil metagenome]
MRCRYQVIRRHVLAALATGVEAGDDDAAREALLRIEWVVRGPARRKLERALIDAALVSNAMVTSLDPEAMRHVQRVAALSLAGRYDVDATKRDEVTDAYATLHVDRAPAPLATVLVGCGVVIFTALLVWAFVALRSPHHRTRGERPMPWGAFALGGVPAYEPAMATLLTEDLTQLVIETDADRHGRTPTRAAHAAHAAHAASLRDSSVIRAHGTGLTSAWHELIDAMDVWAEVPAHSHGYKDAEQHLRASAQHVSDAFAAIGLGYHLEANVLTDRGAAHAAVFSFRVEQVVYVHAGGEPRRVLSLRRLDALDVTHALLGMQTEELGDPVVLLDQIEWFVEHRLSPAVLHGEFDIGDDSFMQTGTGRLLAHAAGRAIQRELVPYNANRAAIERVVTATVRRHEARHGYDNDRETPLRFPTALGAYVGASQGTHVAFVWRSRAELAAYTSQIASDPATPQLALWNLLNLGFNRQYAGSPEAWAGIVIVEGLGRQLRLQAPGPVVRDGHLDRDRLAALALPLASQTDDDLRQAARRLWAEMYAEPMIAIVDQPPIVAKLAP